MLRRKILVKVVWSLTGPLPKRRINEEAEVKPIGKEQLIEIGRILVVTWGGFIKPLKYRKDT